MFFEKHLCQSSAKLYREVICATKNDADTMQTHRAAGLLAVLPISRKLVPI